MASVAYLGFPAPGDKHSFGLPTRSVHGSIDAKNEFGTKGESNADLGPAIAYV